MVHVIETVDGKVMQVITYLNAPGFNANEAAENIAKLICEQNGIVFDAIWFNSHFIPKEKVDTAFSIEENVWNSKTSIQLKIKDIK